MTPLRATPYRWQDPATIARRDWLYGHLLIRKFVSATVAPGGVGKSSLIAAETLAMVSGRNLLGTAPHKRLRIWLWNLEDPQEETVRKLQAAAMHYRLVDEDIDGLFVDSGRDQRLVIAKTDKNRTIIVQPVVDSLVAEIKERAIDVLVIDPFVSSHAAPENDNNAMDAIAKEWGRVADAGNCAVHLVHHTRKMGGGNEAEVTTESSRGGKALTDACRVVRAVNRMTKEESERAGIENHRLFFRTMNDKSNLAPPADKSDWFQLQSVSLGNGPQGGDSVGVVTTWTWPDPLEGITGADFEKVSRVIHGGKWRDNSQSPGWVGYAVAQALDMNADDKSDKSKIKGMIAMWRKAGSLIAVDGKDDKGKNRKFIEVRDDSGLHQEAA